MIEIEIKCWPEPYAALLDGRKTFEWRKDDRPYRLGATLVEREWEPCHRCGQTGISDHYHNPAQGIEKTTCEHCGGSGGNYTGRSARYTVTYILRERFEMPSGYVVMAVERDLRPVIKPKAKPGSDGASTEGT